MKGNDCIFTGHVYTIYCTVSWVYTPKNTYYNARTKKHCFKKILKYAAFQYLPFKTTWFTRITNYTAYTKICTRQQAINCDGVSIDNY